MRKMMREARLMLIGIPIFVWAVFPIYHLIVMAITPQQTAFAGELWPQHPTLQNFGTVFTQGHYYLGHFWQQILNSFVIAVTVALAVLLIATTASFAISRLRVPGGRIVMNLALFTYLIPAAFLAIPMYKAMGTYGLLDNRLSLVLSMIALASPYAIWTSCRSSWTKRRASTAPRRGRYSASCTCRWWRRRWWRSAPMRCCSPGTSTCSPSCCCPPRPS
jgi:multiple sugar transport system permease protein